MSSDDPGMEARIQCHGCDAILHTLAGWTIDAQLASAKSEWELHAPNCTRTRS